MTSSIEKAIQRSENKGKLDKRQKMHAGSMDDSAPALLETEGKSQCHVDLRELEKMGFLVPDSEHQIEMADEYRVIKRPLLVNAFGKGVVPVDNGNLIMIVSALPGEGKTFTTINLGMSMAMEMDTTVLVMDGDLINPALSRIFGLVDKPGLVDLLLDKEMDIGDVIYTTDIPKLKILPAGRSYQHSTELLSGEEMSRVVSELSVRYDDRIILVDAPPLLVTSQANVLAQHAGQILMVVEESSTPQQAVKEAVLQLKEDKVIGMVLNKSTQSSLARMADIMGEAMQQKNENMRVKGRFNDNVAFYFILLFVLTAILLNVSPVYSGMLTMTPMLRLGEVYTDNVTLAASSLEREDYVTELTPGITITANGARLNGVFDYRLQSLSYAKDSNLNTINHQLESGINAEIVRGHLFMDAGAAIEQQNISPDTSSPSLDNINVGNREDVKTVRISPYYQHDIGGKLNTLLRYTHNAIRYDAGASDSDSNRVDIQIGSGRSYSKLKWDANYYDEKIDRDTVNDIHYKSSEAEIEYLVTRYLGVMLRGGQEDNDLQSLVDENNGSYSAGGLSWQPDRRYRLEFLYGNRYKSVAGMWNPTQRTSVEINWYDRDVGLNTGASWDGNLSLRTRNSVWEASYIEEHTIVQQTQLENGVSTDPETGVISIEPGSTIETGEGLRLTDDVFLRKRAQISFDYDTRKSDMSFLVFSEKREFQVAAGIELDKAKGAGFSWDWNFATELNFLIDTGWRETTYRTNNRNDDLKYYEIGLAKNLRKMTASVRYRHTNLDSSDDSADYDENRIALYLDASF